MPFVFALSFVAMWLAVTFLLSYISGWALLARNYRAQRAYMGRFERVRNSRMGPLGPFGGARNALSFGVDASGIFLRMFVLFRINCRDLFIPWTDITITRGKSFFVEYVELHFRLAPNIPLRIYGKAGQTLQALATELRPAHLLSE